MAGAFFAANLAASFVGDYVRRRSARRAANAVLSTVGTLRIRGDFREVYDWLDRLEVQTHNALANTLNRTAFKLAREEWPDIAADKLDRPIPFTQKAGRYDKATPLRPEAKIFLRPEVEQYLLRLITGRPGVRKIMPAVIKLNKYGNIPSLRAGRKVQQLLAKKDHFRATIRGIDAIWKRKGRRVEPVLLFERELPARKQLDYQAEMRRRVGPILRKEGREEVRRAIARARR